MNLPLHNPLGPLMVDIAGLTLTEADRQLLRHPAVGGVILFSRNFKDIATLKALTADIKALRTPSLIIAVDHEGGRVQRFRQDFTQLPRMGEIGKLYDKDRHSALRWAHACGQVMGMELGACQIDLSFAPILDLDYGFSQVIGDRSFHRTPQAVTAMAGALIDGMTSAGMAAVGKHFPGHGFVTPDSHIANPVDERSYDQIAAEDLQPFADLHAKLAGVMTAHVIYKNVAPELATFSKFWLQTVLREQLHFKGVIFSDDLTMHAAASLGSIEECVDKAFAAGNTMALICNNREVVDQVIAYYDRGHHFPHYDLEGVRHKKSHLDQQALQAAYKILAEYEVKK